MLSNHNIIHVIVEFFIDEEVNMSNNSTHLNNPNRNAIFLGRAEEQERFRDALHAVLREPGVVGKFMDWVKEKDQSVIPFVFLLYGEGGMGKSSLAHRLREIAQNEDAFENRFGMLSGCMETQQVSILPNLFSIKRIILR